jgi:small subunit ribosomal protein S8
MDPVADMLTKIRNAQVVLHPMVSVFYSDLKYEIIKILERYGFIEKIEKKGRKTKRTIDIYLKYQDKVPAISGLRKISKPGQRIYSGFQTMSRIKKNSGILVVSTPKGVMSDIEARKQKLGGEIICEIW